MLLLHRPPTISDFQAPPVVGDKQCRGDPRVRWHQRCDAFDQMGAAGQKCLEKRLVRLATDSAEL